MAARGNIRLVVSDVDGTLVNKAKEVTPATVAAVKRLKAAGIGFTIVSARPMSGMRWIADLLEIDGPMGAFNGGLVFRRDGSVERRAFVAAEVARGVLELVGDAADAWVFADDQWYATSGDGPHTDSERRASGQEPVVRTDFADLLDRCDKLTFVSDDEASLRDLAERAAERFGGRATIAQSQTYYLDVTATAANKGDGVRGLADAAGVPLEQVCAIGDQANDLPMLELAGRAVAMGNAPDRVKRAADTVTASNEEDGVARAIDELLS